MSTVVERNIEALLQRRHEEYLRKKFGERIADKVSAFAGSMIFVYLHLALFGTWIVINLVGFLAFQNSTRPSSFLRCLRLSKRSSCLPSF